MSIAHGGRVTAVISISRRWKTICGATLWWCTDTNWM